jgi:fatty acid CoA ligase FadD9
MLGAAATKRPRVPPARLGFEEQAGSDKPQPPLQKKNRKVARNQTRKTAAATKETQPQSLVGSSCAATFGAICERYSDRPLVGTLAADAAGYTWTTYSEFGRMVERFSTALIHRFAVGDAVGICAANRLEWLVADWSCVRAGVVSIPIHVHRAADAAGLSGVAKAARLTAVVCEPEQLATFRALDDPPLQLIFVLDSPDGAAAAASSHGARVISFASQVAADAPVVPPRPHAPTAISTVIWSSGTTGVPKGAALREATLLEDLANEEADRDDSERPPVQLAIYSFAYSLERDTFQTIALYGGQMAMFAQPLHRVFVALELLQPTCILGVPALWSALHHEFEREVAATSTATAAEARAAVAQRFGTRFGNRLEVVSSGTAPLPPQVREFMWSVFPTYFIGEGYGTQEVGLITLEGKIRKGVTVRLRDVDGYSAKDKPHPRGEICVRTATMVEGYFEDPERTAKAFIRSGPLAGFFCTGDVGELIRGRRGRGRKRKEPQLRVIDRCKSIFKLAGGEYVNPAGLEAHYSAVDCVRQVFVTGSSSYPTIDIVVVASAKFLAETREEEWDTVMLHALRVRGRWLNLRTHEIPRVCVVEKQMWTPVDGTLTPSAKLARPTLSRKYDEALASRRKRAATADILELLPVDATDSDTLVDLGVSSLEAFQLAERSGLSIEFLLAASTTVADLRAASLAGTGIDVQTLEVQIKEDLKLSPQAVLTSFGDEAADALDDNGDVFFLTGATGFVGSFLTKQLLESHPGSCCFVLVRGDDSRARLEASLHEAGCADDMCARVNVVQGDLSREQFGLPDTRFVEIARVVRAVFHVGAQVDWLRPYADLRAANVVGTATAISLAITAKAPLHHISSGAVSGVAAEPADLVQESGYTASKAVAESLVARAVEEKGLVATIYRVGTVTASAAASCVVNREDYASRYIESCFELSMAVDSPALFETIPVDTCAKLIATIATSEEQRPLILPIANPASWSHADLARELHAVDARIRAVDAATFADAVSRSNCRLRPLSLALHDSSWFAEDQIDPCCATAVALGVSTLALPITAEYFSRWVSALGITVL